MKTRQFLSFVLLLILGAGMTACKGGKAKESQESTEEAAAATVLGVDNVLAAADEYVGDTITLEGVCTHICEHGGCKIFLMGSDDTRTLRIEAGEAIGSFPPETVKSVVRVTGTLVEERIDEAFLTEWESELANEPAEAEAEEGTEEEVGCAADMQANSEAAANSVEERIANFRARIAERTEQEGKPYVSIYHMVADRYEIL